MTFTSLQQDYLGGGLAAARPNAAVLGPTIPPGSCAFYFATDTNVLYRLAGGDTAWQVASGGGGGAGAVTLISSVTTSGGAATINFASIPNTYNHLQIKLFGGSASTNGASSDTGIVQFNGDTNGANYESTGQGLYGGVAAFPSSPGIFLASTGAPTSFGQTTIDIINYNDSTNQTMFNAVSAAVQNSVGICQVAGAGRWKSNAAVTDIELKVNGNVWANGSTAWLYGIT